MAVTAEKGIDYVIQINEGSESTPSWSTIGGQRGGTLNLSGDAIDATSKDGAGWEDKLVGLRTWSIDGDGLHGQDDTALEKLYDEFIAGNMVQVRFQLPDGGTYEGKTIISDLSIDAPHDGEATASVTLEGAEALTDNT